MREPQFLGPAGENVKTSPLVSVQSCSIEACICSDLLEEQVHMCDLCACTKHV